MSEQQDFSNGNVSEVKGDIINNRDKGTEGDEVEALQAKIRELEESVEGLTQLSKLRMNKIEELERQLEDGTPLSFGAATVETTDEINRLRRENENYRAQCRMLRRRLESAVSLAAEMMNRLIESSGGGVQNERKSVRRTNAAQTFGYRRAHERYKIMGRFLPDWLSRIHGTTGQTRAVHLSHLSDRGGSGRLLARRGGGLRLGTVARGRREEKLHARGLGGAKEGKSRMKGGEKYELWQKNPQNINYPVWRFIACGDNLAKLDQARRALVPDSVPYMITTEAGRIVRSSELDKEAQE